MSHQVKIAIPAPLRPYTGQRRDAEVTGATVGEALEALMMTFRDLRQYLVTREGSLHGFVNIYVNDMDVRDLQGTGTPLHGGETISIIPTIAGGSVAQDDRTETGFSQAEMARYSRHLLLPEIGLAGQQKLKAARVLCIGAGGLGSPAALYLAAAGVGTLGLVDHDLVELSNLQRQVLHGTKDVGRPKLASAKTRLADMNPEVGVELHHAQLSASNALQIMESYDLVLDGTDNFPTRYLVNDACTILSKPLVYGSIFRFEGQASVFLSGKGPCYRCLFPSAPPSGLVPDCAEGGVLGVLPGIVGLIQATEAIKLITGVGEPLAGRLLSFDALEMKFREYKITRRSDCQTCAVSPTKLVDYAQVCGARPGDSDITPLELQALLERGESFTLIDVREPHEHAINRIPGAVLIPLSQLQAAIPRLDSARPIIVHCKSGGRSARAADLLRQNGFTRVRNLTNGIIGWIRDIDPTQPTY